jgi:hypothetical protein
MESEAENTLKKKEKRYLELKHIMVAFSFIHIYLTKKEQ